jgi:hypothetical protein
MLFSTSWWASEQLLFNGKLSDTLIKSKMFILSFWSVKILTFNINVINSKTVNLWWWDLTKFYHITPHNPLMCTSCFIFLQIDIFSHHKPYCVEILLQLSCCKCQWWTGHPTFLWKTHNIFKNSFTVDNMVALLMNFHRTMLNFYWGRLNY